MTSAKTYNFVNVKLKKDVAILLQQIHEDMKREKLFISNSDLIRVMLNNKAILEYAIKTILNEKSHDFEKFMA